MGGPGRAVLGPLLGRGSSSKGAGTAYICEVSSTCPHTSLEKEKASWYLDLNSPLDIHLPKCSSANI